MNLLAMKTEVLNKGFDPTQYGTRIVQWINDGQNLVARRVDYYVDEATSSLTTIPGTSVYAWPAGLAHIRSLFDTTRNIEMQYVSIRDIDRSPVANGAPMFYALQGENFVLYPVPDSVYNLECRYWMMPPPLAANTDTPTIPADWHHMLICYATWQAYESDDDPQAGQYWETRFEKELSMFSADVKFPDTDGPVQARGMWEQDASLSPAGWVAGG